MNNTELTNALWAIESHINSILASPHEGAGTTRLQEALEDAEDLQMQWDFYKAMHMDFCMRKAVDLGALSREKYDELIKQLGAAIRAEPDPGEARIALSKREGVFRTISRIVLLFGVAIAVVLMVVAAVATVMHVSFSDLLWYVASITGLIIMVLGAIWLLTGGDTGPSVAELFGRKKK